MISKLTQNIPIKIISLIAGVTVWIIITNVTNPIVNGFVNVPITFENEDAVYNLNKTYSIKGSNYCKVSFKVSSKELTKIKQSDFRAYVDLNDTQYTDKLNIQVEALNNVDNEVSNITVEPKTLNVTLNDSTRRGFTVEAKVKGPVDAEHVVGSPDVSPKEIFIDGSIDKLTKISKITAEIIIDSSKDTFSGTAKVKILDTDGKQLVPEVEGFKLTTDEVNYSVEVYKKKEVTFNVITIGTSPKGYAYKGFATDPNVLTIYGPAEVIDSIESVDLGPIDIANIKQSTLLPYKVSSVLPLGVYSDWAKDITVKVDVVEVDENILNMPEEKQGPDLTGGLGDITGSVQ